MPRSCAALSVVATLTVLAAVVPAGPASAAPALQPPAEGKIRVAFVLAPHATVIDFTGPWEVFQDVEVPERGERRPFELYTVAETRDPVTATGGLRILPDHTFDDAPQPHVIVVPALRGSPRLHAWLRQASPKADLTMSVCTGAFQLARAGLLDGLEATTHHLFLDAFAREFPEVKLRRGVRFVDNGKVASAAGLTSGIDLALRVVERYFGRDVATATAEYMEHASREWMEEEGVGSPPSHALDSTER